MKIEYTVHSVHRTTYPVKVPLPGTELMVDAQAPATVYELVTADKAMSHTFRMQGEPEFKEGDSVAARVHSHRFRARARCRSPGGAVRAAGAADHRARRRRSHPHSASLIPRLADRP